MYFIFIFLLISLYATFFIERPTRYSKGLMFLGVIIVSMYFFITLLIWIYIFSYLLIFGLNKVLPEIYSFNLIKDELRNYCFIIALTPIIINDFIVLIYMILKKSRKEHTYNVMVTFLVSSILLFLLLTIKYPTLIIKYIVPIIYFIALLIRKYIIIGTE